MIKLFDAHFHIVSYNFAVIENEGYTPPEFLPNDYLQRMSKYDLVGGAIIAGSFQGNDTQFLKWAISELGQSYVGVINANANLSDQDIIALDKVGIKAIRYNIKRGSKELLKHIENLSSRVWEIAKWHSEFYIDSKDIKSLKSTLVKLPKLVIDHIGLSIEGFSDILDLVANGAYIKASGFGRLNFDPITAILKIMQINPYACMFGSDLPSTRATRPFSHSDVDLITNNFDTKDRELILYQNAINMYLRRKFDT